MARDSVKIDPWSSAQYQDYARLRDEFGIQEYTPDFLARLHEKQPDRFPRPQKLFRRGAVFGHRGFEKVEEAIASGKPWAVLTGLMPSGRMHIGNKMVIDQVLYFQELGADIFVAVADIESFATRDMSLEKGRELAINEFILNYIAMGLKPERCQIYFQSRRKAVKDMAWKLGRKVNWSEMRAIYGFNDSTNLAHVQAPLVQVGDILHVQLEQYGGPRPTVVPVGVDQDPHMRLTRGLASAHRRYNVVPGHHGGSAPKGETWSLPDNCFSIFVKGDEKAQSLLDKAIAALENLGYHCNDMDINAGYKAISVLKGKPDLLPEQEMSLVDSALIQAELPLNPHAFYQPSATFNKFMTGLTGEKMSSSKPETSIYLTDTPEEVKKKIMGAKTGGRDTLAEQKEKGGVPEVGVCTVFELFFYHLTDDDKELAEIHDTCSSGERTCGTCKKLAAERMTSMLDDLAGKREAARSELDNYLRED